MKKATVSFIEKFYLLAEINSRSRWNLKILFNANTFNHKIISGRSFLMRHYFLPKLCNLTEISRLLLQWATVNKKALTLVFFSILMYFKNVTKKLGANLFFRRKELFLKVLWRSDMYSSKYLLVSSLLFLRKLYNLICKLNGKFCMTADVVKFNEKKSNLFYHIMIRVIHID